MRRLSPLEAMTYAAACTTTLRLGCTVFVTTLHSPVHLAKAIASLDQMSGGRVEVGVGSGGPRRPFSAFGLSPDRYVARFTEGLALMKELWTKEDPAYQGKTISVEGIRFMPKPVQKPYPPIVLGGHTEPSLKRCPTCKSKVERMISNTSFVLKGTGWYATDYARSGSKSNDAAGDKPGDNSSDKPSGESAGNGTNGSSSATASCITFDGIISTSPAFTV